MVGEGKGKEGALDGVRVVREGEGDGGVGLRVVDGVDGEGAGVEEEGAGVRVVEGDEGGTVDGGGGEVEVECQGDVGGGWVRRVCE